MSGWLKIHRQLLDSPVFDNEKLFKVFMYCLMKASHKEHEQLVGKQFVTLKPGQFVFGRKRASLEANMPPSTVWSYLLTLQNLKTLDIKSNNKFSVITIVNWGLYQHEEKSYDSNVTTNEQQMNNRITTDEQQMNTNKNVKNGENGKNDNTPSSYSTTFPYKEIINYLNESAGKKYKHTTEKTKTFISARYNEGFTLEDFKSVIDIKTKEWLGSNMEKFIRPETLFSNKFEGYLNQDGNGVQEMNNTADPTADVRQEIMNEEGGQN